MLGNSSRKASEPSQVVAQPSEMSRDEPRVPMPPEEVVLLPDDLLEGGAPARGLYPLWSKSQLEPALIEAVVRLPKLCGVG